MKVKGNLIIDEGSGVILPVQHIREMSLYGGTVLVKLSGANACTINMPDGKPSGEIMAEISDAYLKAYRNYEEKNLSSGDEIEHKTDCQRTSTAKAG